MKRQNLLIAVVLFVVCQISAQTIQDPDNAILLSHNFDQSQGRLDFYSDNRDFCDYHLYVSFIYTEGFEGMSSGRSAVVGTGRRQVMSYRVRKDATRYSYNYRYAMYRGDSSKKIDVDFVYLLPVADKGAVTANVVENPEGYQLAFDLSSDTVYACRGGVMCDDKLKDNTAKGNRSFNSHRNKSQITLYHADGSFGEYVFEGKPLIYPGQRVIIGSPIAVVKRIERYPLCFSVYFLDKNKLNDANTGNKHTHFRPFFYTVNEGNVRLENDRTYLSEHAYEVLSQEKKKREKKTGVNAF